MDRARAMEQRNADINISKQLNRVIDSERTPKPRVAAKSSYSHRYTPSAAKSEPRVAYQRTLEERNRLNKLGPNSCQTPTTGL